MTNILDNAFWLWLLPLSWCQKRGGLWLKLRAAARVPFAFSQTLPRRPLVGHLIFLCLQEIENNTSKRSENTFLSHRDIVRVKSFRLQSSWAPQGGEMQKDLRSALLLEGSIHAPLWECSFGLHHQQEATQTLLSIHVNVLQAFCPADVRSSCKALKRNPEE